MADQPAMVSVHVHLRPDEAISADVYRLETTARPYVVRISHADDYSGVAVYGSLDHLRTVRDALADGIAKLERLAVA